MMVRLAFAVMVEADADIMLIDEVLAVGDAAFAQKCLDVFRERREAGKTIVLVTHDMATVQAFCDRAMLLHDGEVRYVGEAEEAAMRYYRLNFGGADGAAPGDRPDVNASLIDAWLEDEHGDRIDNVEQGEPIRFNLIVQARYDLERPVFGFHFMNVDGVPVFGFNKELTRRAEEPDRIAAGERVHIAGSVENRLVPGRYFVSCWVARNRNANDIALQVLRAFDFVVYGTQPAPGVVLVDAEVDARIERRSGA
jgi:energy-coupling factor transporter ATP-binding protein EcfA2